jgi:sugar phosphate permease
MHTDSDTGLKQATRRALRRIIPFALLMYILAFLDRVNVGFAKQAFQVDTGIDNAAFALGAGLFFIGYALFETPSNMLMHRVGARLWMSRIMVTWGLVSAAMAWAHDVHTFYVLRFLLGVAEAGFFPGMMLYFTYWFPAATRGKVVGLFYFGPSLAFIFGSPLSGALLELDGVAGFHGWQWLFVVEGVLASLVGVIAFFYLDDRPSDAKWLPEGDRLLLASAVAAEDSAKQAHSPRGLLSVLTDPKVLYCSLVLFLIQVSVYGVTFYLPSTVSAILGKKVGFEVGVVAAIPWLCALIAAYVIPSWSDRTGERALTGAATLAAGGLGIIAAAGSLGPWAAFAGLCIAACGFIAVQPIFFTFPTGYLAGAAAASGLGFIGSLGNLGGFFAPNIRVMAETFFQSPAAGLYTLAALTLLGAALMAAFPSVGLRPRSMAARPARA